MADTPHTFSEAGARRIVDAVRRSERMPVPSVASPPAGGAPRESFGCRAVEISSVPGAALGKYSGTLINADFGSPGSAITLNFYHPFEISGGSVLLEVDDIVTIQRVDRDSLSDIVGSAVAEGDNWICVGRGGFVVEESDGSPTLTNPRKIAVDQSTGLKGAVSGKTFTIQGDLEVTDGTTSVRPVKKVKFIGATVAGPGGAEADVTVGGGGSGSGDGGAYRIWTHNRTAGMSGTAETVDVSGADVRGKLLDFRMIIAANTGSVGSVNDYWIPPCGAGLLASGTAVVDEVLDSGGANSLLNPGPGFVDTTGRVIGGDFDRDIAVTTGHHVPFPGGGANISGGGAGLYVDSGNGHLYLRVVSGAAASATQIVLLWRVCD